MKDCIEYLIEHYTGLMEADITVLRTNPNKQTKRRLKSQIWMYKNFVGELKEVVKGEADNSGPAA